MEAELVRLGLVAYEDALRMQRQLAAARHRGEILDQVLAVRHPHLYTMGRRATPENILLEPRELEARGIQVHRSDRGGDVTYHGPGQLVLYPILALPPSRQNVERYVHDLEETMIRTLATFGIAAGRAPGLPGAWVGSDKIGAIGVHLSHWVTSHGLALNVNPDLEMFAHIVPCGIRDRGVTSMARLLGAAPQPHAVEEVLLEHFATLFGLTWKPRAFDLETVQVFLFHHAPALELLCLHREGPEPFWQPVTGKIEPGERPAEAAVREAIEETGLTGTLVDLDYVHGFTLDPTVVTVPGHPFPCYVREHSFGLEVPPGAAVRLDARTHDAFRWLPLEEALTLLQWPGNREGSKRAARAAARATTSW